MNCPFDLPTKKKPDGNNLWIVVSRIGLILSIPLKDFEADYIVQAINSHEKLVDAIDEIEAVSCGEKQIESDGVYDDSDGMSWIYKRIQALGEIKSNEDSNTK